MKKTIKLALVSVLATAALWAGDLTIGFNSKGKGPMGVKTDGVETHYYSSKFQRINNEGSKIDTLIDYQTLTTYTINHSKKLTQKLSFEDAMAAMEGMQSQMPEGMGAMMGAFFGDPNNFKVEELGSETVVGRNCKKYKITVGKMVFESSNDPSLVPPIPAANFAKMVKAKGALTAAAGPMGKTMARLYEEMSKIRGLALKTSMSGFMGLNANTEATKITEGPIPAAVFELPAGYKVEDLGKQLREQVGKAH
jgi:hypothetical protein